MPLRLPLCPLSTVCALYAVAPVVVIVAAHAGGDLGVPLDALIAGGGVALDRLFHGDLGGALEAFAAMFQG